MNKISISKSLIEIKEALIESQSHPMPLPTKEEMDLIATIKMKTSELNQNNVTRTKAYFAFYKNHPEVHWAFLAHMVSRNGGWNMTDLKGDFLVKLLDKRARDDFFSFLERGNWLIFQDAYPQLLLYEESLKIRHNLFHLFKFFNISRFMETIWNHFWIYRDPYVLTIALVINEQSYLEKQLMGDRQFKDKVIDTFEFKLQEILSFNQILFPYEADGQTKFLGQTINQFDSLHERIMIGKRLYHLLFSSEQILNRTKQWAKSHSHTASRKDYWPHLFNDVKEYAPGNLYMRRLKNCKLRKGMPRIYCPRLDFAWKNVDHPPAEEGDWFSDWRVIDYLKEDIYMVNGEIMNEYCETLENLELVTIAKKAIFL
ncbi:DUF2515 family protein [Pseudoneobacillus sp. C159]